MATQKLATQTTHLDIHLTTEPSEFDKAYFIQTREEIDTEKRERDTILNFCVAILGAVAFGIIQSDNAQTFFKDLTPASFAIGISALLIISSLFWVRYKKMQQISDRWFTLLHLMEHFGNDPLNEPWLEKVVTDSFKTSRYNSKDLVLNIVFSLPFYGLWIIQTFQSKEQWRIALPFVIILHLVIICYILGRKFTDPFKGKVFVK